MGGALLGFRSFPQEGRRVLFGLQFVNSDAGIGTNKCAGCAADAGFGTRISAVGIALAVDLCLRKLYGVGWTGNDAKVASFAALCIDDYSSLNFSHILCDVYVL